MAKEDLNLNISFEKEELFSRKFSILELKRENEILSKQNLMLKSIKQKLEEDEGNDDDFLINSKQFDEIKSQILPKFREKLKSFEEYANYLKARNDIIHKRIGKIDEKISEFKNIILNGITKEKDIKEFATKVNEVVARNEELKQKTVEIKELKQYLMQFKSEVTLTIESLREKINQKEVVEKNQEEQEPSNAQAQAEETILQNKDGEKSAVDDITDDSNEKACDNNDGGRPLDLVKNQIQDEPEDATSSNAINIHLEENKLTTDMFPTDDNVIMDNDSLNEDKEENKSGNEESNRNEHVKETSTSLNPSDQFLILQKQIEYLMKENDKLKNVLTNTQNSKDIEKPGSNTEVKQILTTTNNDLTFDFDDDNVSDEWDVASDQMSIDDTIKKSAHWQKYLNIRSNILNNPNDGNSKTNRSDFFRKPNPPATTFKHFRHSKLSDTDMIRVRPFRRSREESKSFSSSTE